MAVPPDMSPHTLTVNRQEGLALSASSIQDLGETCVVQNDIFWLFMIFN